ncbi:hypothetical protein B7435_02030 [Mycolicibacterium peregrinum]|jgi:hypothetical protein|uniref:Secreted protein n=1 Tax=Mycolicibacterium fortuitum subsp. fortuitum DSM 46621 = ATCC 6841 = JCM 6387 TaxID=1214102 RepID=K0V283_MYCFO|nr:MULTISPECIES: hypothetical protein [Mycolicibacterium]AIY48241.1 hypothetical protein G155_24965 [Mycobacterium sp. VKM Ac-1817D]CRL73207.1 hypothetical protein CPGR_01079 [Mycolicibacter nonchromogenicus]EJZ11435.1 hypothetical protein MFORT_18892 [Mycolicibacterium fortuitum subsp. fortuitum DSM 46621 = ATCC 6841 = JCM 6387]MCV7206394.1 hypothetical protein [Mycolicibacterium peregrinum]MDG5769962.1 hypothetical protein [Mycolicibacterium fortuitum]
MSTITRRIAAGFTLAAAPALIALGAATSHADSATLNAGPSVSAHQAFPHQHNMPQPGSSTHHHHQRNHAK